MIYFPKSKTKFLLYFLCALLFLNWLFISTKSYSFDSSYDTELRNISQTQYEDYLSSMNLRYKSDFIKNTQIKYLYVFPEYSLLIIYFGYFLAAIFFIKYLKISTDETTI